MLKKTRKKLVNEITTQLKAAAANTDYSKWETDFGFLMLCINQQTNIFKKYYLDVYSSQLVDKTAMVRDSDVKDKMSGVVTDVYNSLSDSYINFLTTKYFKNNKQLIKFISETVTDKVIEMTIGVNTSKINNLYVDKNIDTINKLNANTENKQ